MRDNFSKQTIRQLEVDAGHVCSYPQCRLVTRGDMLRNGTNASESAGQAAHITAASPKGPRYDPSLSHDQRRDISNGIWMCYTHGKYIDSAHASISAETLKAWKMQHESDVKNGLITPQTVRRPDTRNYIREISVEGIGPFKDYTIFPLRRYNFVVGGNGAGKTTVAQLACRCAGNVASISLDKRFLDGINTDEAHLKIKFGSESSFDELSYKWKKQGTTMRFQQTGLDLSNAIRINNALKAIVVDSDYQYIAKTKSQSLIRQCTSGLSGLLNLKERDFIAILSQSGDKVTSVGYRLRAAKNGLDLEVCRNNDGWYQKFSQLSGTEQMLTVLDIALRCVGLIPALQCWLLIIEHDYIERLFYDFGPRFADILLTLPSNIQLLACALEEKTIRGILGAYQPSFVRVSCANDLTIWTSQTDELHT